MVKQYNVLLDTMDTIPNPSFNVNTNDLKTLKISILINQDKEPLDLTGATVRLAVKKPDQKTVLEDCTIVDPLAGSCEVVLGTQAYNVAGTHEAEVMVYYASDTVAVTSSFSYIAKKGILSDDTIESTNEFQSITQAIADNEALLEDLRTNGTGIDAQARADIETQATQLAQKAKQTDVTIERKRQFSKIRKNNTISALNRYAYPLRSDGTPFSLRYDELPIVFTDNQGGFTTNFDVANFKNTGGKTIYMSTTTGLSSNDGLTRNTPCQSLEKAMVLAVNGDTIICIDPEGTMISRAGWANDGVISKNVNIIAENKIVAFKGDTPTWVLTSGYTKTYEVTRSAVERVVDFNNMDIPVEYKKVASIAEVEANKYSWYTDNVKTYVNSGGNKVPNNKILPLLTTGRAMVQNANASNVSTQSAKIYLENLILVGGDKVVHLLGDANFNNHELYTKNCKFYYSTALDCVLTQNAKRSYHQGSICAYSVKDGFNYSTTIGNSNIPDFIEVNCKAFANGDNTINTANTHNGSTAHAKSYGIRINCTYYHNVGGNQIDVQGVKSVNLGIVTFDSKATDATWSQGMGTQGAQGVESCELWYEGCISFGNDSDVYVPTGETVHVKLCQYDTVNGGGIRDFDERL
ncbi:protein of unknown function [Bacillus sp. OV166]|uniref:BppU family phage baseplate upper protein n=1 Tax=Bacillus sp. OV166 TaxID=1882763 RepID=UPI000A2AE3B7|nr:BppU family phage baseplate upper protein [Bacillus sp. OV166]SMQ75985.1 protein of unknown function [Bacillus sp. OV166]